jgi:hypothetical protein
MDSGLHALILKQVRRDLKAFDFAPDVLARNMQKMRQLMVQEEKTCRRLMCVTICKNGTVTFDNIFHDNITIHQLNNKTPEQKKWLLSSRFQHLMKMIQTTASLYRLPAVKFYMFACDTYFHKFKDLPVFVIAKPSNREGILMPDNTFSQKVPWVETLSEIQRNQTPVHMKDPIVYFKGGRTGKEVINVSYGYAIHQRKWGSRCIFEKYSDTSKIIEVNINGPQEHMYSWSKYKYLLNLPGGQPWSYRFKYLLATGSLVIDVVLQQQYGNDPSNYNQRWDCFFDCIVRHNIDYIQVPLRWIEGDNIHNDLEHARVLTRIENIYRYYEKNEEAYVSMVNSCTRQVNRITEASIFHGLSVVIKEYAAAIEAARIAHPADGMGCVAGLKRPRVDIERTARIAHPTDGMGCVAGLKRSRVDIELGLL